MRLADRLGQEALQLRQERVAGGLAVRRRDLEHEMQQEERRLLAHVGVGRAQQRERERVRQLGHREEAWEEARVATEDGVEQLELVEGHLARELGGDGRRAPRLRHQPEEQPRELPKLGRLGIERQRRARRSLWRGRCLRGSRRLRRGRRPRFRRVGAAFATALATAFATALATALALVGVHAHHGALVSLEVHLERRRRHRRASAHLQREERRGRRLRRRARVRGGALALVVVAAGVPVAELLD